MKTKKYVTIDKLNRFVGDGNGPVEIEVLDNDQFLKVKETLSRIGIATKEDENDVLWQSCHLLSKKGKYYIVHFKHMFLLDGAFKALEIAQKHHVSTVVLKENSPSCGTNFIYDGSFSGTKVIGLGITACLLKQHGFHVISENDFLKSLD